MMRRRRRGPVVLFLLVLCGLPIVWAASDEEISEKCSAPEMRQLDFWLGEWDLTSRQRDPDNPDRARKITMHNSVRRILDGCVIVERFNGTPAIPLRGASVSHYDRDIGKWRQTWVDNQGGWYNLTGEYKDGKVVLTTPDTVRGGKRMRWRMIFSEIARDGLDWEWQRSTDAGLTWESRWRIHYSRRKQPPGTP